MRLFYFIALTALSTVAARADIIRSDNAWTVKPHFEKTEAREATSPLALGDNVGIRDLAKVKDGVLILSGRSDDERGDQKFTCEEQRTPPWPLSSVWFWSGKDGEVAKPLGPLPGVAATDSAETLLVLDESTTAYRVLVLFDGVANGKPVEFNIRK
ncbi:hypothetical protein AB4Z01_01190 [Inquilinus sp. YAF38]|uniref:hypothetical protein n=1 Tax=Inquilinus sp. YAF38 TaxID=3233084 RepID=UPI003F90115A